MKDVLTAKDTFISEPAVSGRVTRLGGLGSGKKSIAKRKQPSTEHATIRSTTLSRGSGCNGNG